MRKTHLVSSVGLLAALLLGIGLLTSVAQASGPDGIILILKQVPFSEAIKHLSDVSGLDIKMQVDVETPVDINFPEETSLDKVLASITPVVGLDYWKEGDTYVIGKRSTATDVVPNLDPLPRMGAQLSPATNPDVKKPGTLPTLASTDDKTLPKAGATGDGQDNWIVERVMLNYTSAKEVAWALGVAGVDLDPQSQRRVRQQIRSMKEPPQSARVNPNNALGADYTSPALNDYWRNVNYGRSSRVNSETDQYQAGTSPFPPLTGGGGAVGGGAAGAPATPGAPGANAAAGSLAQFMPEGIDQVIGLVGLNALLVKAKSKEAIQQLQQLISLLDTPVKQVMIEVLFVQMDVNDAFELGLSWEIAGTPISTAYAGGGGDGNWRLRYLKGNIKAAIGTKLAKTTSKVVNAPRIIVQNGGSAFIEMTESHPFLLSYSSTDVFGREVTVPEIDSQEFTRGFEVSDITIHPDNSMTLDFDLPWESQGAGGISLPGSDQAGSLSAVNTTTISTRVRVKDGETLMMGGFVSHGETRGSSGIPLLSDIPILGRLLFSSVNKSYNDVETLMFLTINVLKDDTTDFGGMSTLPPLF